jgi:amino acid transporter
MMTPARHRLGVVAEALARDRLPGPATAVFTLTAATPLLVVSGLVPTGWAQTGVMGLPGAFVILGLVLIVASAGYVAMSRYVVNAGAFYSYVALGLGKAYGVAAAFLAVVAYTMLYLGLYGIFGVVAQGVFRAPFGIMADWWVYAAVAWAVIAAMGVLRIDLSGKVLGVLLAAEVAVMVIVAGANLGHPAAGVVSAAAFRPRSVFVAGAGTAFVIAITAFTGFEIAPVFGEEARRPRRTVPAVTYASLIVMTVLYAITTWSMSVAAGPRNVVATARRDGPEMFFEQAARTLGGNRLVVDIGHALLLTSVFAAMASYQNLLARYLFALGREGVLPRVLGRTYLRTGAPGIASLAQSVTTAVILGAYVVNGWDPLRQLFFWLGTTGGLGVLMLLTAVSLAAFAFFRRDRRDESAWSRIVAPVIATAALGFVAYLTLAGYPGLLNVAGDDPVRWILPGCYVLAALIGFGWAAILRRHRPTVYASIGHGAAAGLTLPALAGGPALQLPSGRADALPEQRRSSVESAVRSTSHRRRGR